MKKRMLALLMVVSMVGALVVGCGSTATEESTSESTEATTEVADTEEHEEIVLKLTTTQSDASESAEMDILYALQENLESSFDYVTVEIYPSEQLGSQTEMAQGVQAGTIEIAILNYSILNSYYEETMIPTCPGFFTDEAEVNAVMQGEYGDTLHAALEEETGIKILTAVCNGFRCFTSNTELTTIESAQGQSFRCMENSLSVVMVEAVGAVAVPMASGEMYTAMQNGTVDGQENPIVNIINDKTYEVQDYLTLNNHMASMFAVIMSGDCYDSLPTEVQEVIDATIEEQEPLAIETVNRINEEGVEYLESVGVSVYQPTDEELAAWQEPIATACEEYVRTELGDEPIDEILTAIEEYRAAN